MNKKGQTYIEKGIVFLILWLITGLIWSIWLKGIEAAIAGCLTSLAVVSITNIILGRK